MLKNNKERQQAKYNAEKAAQDAKFGREKEQLELERTATANAKVEARLNSAGSMPSGDS